MEITPNPEKKARRKELLNEPYPMNLMLTINEVISRMKPLETEDIEQDNIDGLLYAVTLLQERTQEVIRLRYAEKQTYKKIGEKLGISAEGAHYLVSQAERKLRSRDLYGYIKYGKVGSEERRIRLEKERRKDELGVMEKPIDELHLKTRTEIRLLANGCRTVGDVAAMTRNEILSIRMFGRASVHEVAANLGSLGVAYSEWSYII